MNTLGTQGCRDAQHEGGQIIVLFPKNIGFRYKRGGGENVVRPVLPPSWLKAVFLAGGIQWGPPVAHPQETQTQDSQDRSGQTLEFPGATFIFNKKIGLKSRGKKRLFYKFLELVPMAVFLQWQCTNC